MPTRYYGTTGTTAPAALQQPDLAGLKEAIDAANRAADQQARALRELFEANGYDLANGDVLYHAPDVHYDVPQRYRAQVQPHQMVQAGQIVFMRNPRFSLF